MSSGHHNDDHHSMEQKPVSFTVPFFLATAVILAIVLFLSLCDPKPHHAGVEGHGHDGASTEAAHHHEAAATEHHGDEHSAGTEEKKDSMSVETTVPDAEPVKEHH